MIEKTCLIILGMHRSGTSAITGSIGLAGADLGTNLHGETFYNQRGLFEDVQINLVNLRYLYNRKTNWYRLYRYWPSVELDTKFIEKLVAHLNTFSGQVLAIKDPRICLLIPLYEEAMKQAGIKPVYVVVNRPIDHIAHSLRTRDRMPLLYGYILTRFYQRQISRFLAAVGREPVQINYQQFLEDPVKAISQVLHEAGTPLTVTDPSRITAFVSRDLNHGKSASWSVKSLFLNGLSAILLPLFLKLNRFNPDAWFTKSIITHDFDFNQYKKNNA